MYIYTHTHIKALAIPNCSQCDDNSLQVQGSTEHVQKHSGNSNVSLQSALQTL